MTADLIRLANFADDDLVRMARDVVASNQGNFVDSALITGGREHRDSQILWHAHFQSLFGAFGNRLRETFDTIRSAFPSLMPPDDPEIEMHLTIHGDGQFYKKHQDNGDGPSRTRKITYVWYFTPIETKGFTEGFLVIDGESGQIHTVEPDHNSIVFFPSHCWHEVRPCVVPSKRWQDSRATLNGWLRCARVAV